MLLPFTGSIKRFNTPENFRRLPMRTHALINMRADRLRILAALASLALALPVQASFHLNQIEQVIGGVNGDTTAQAVQLRMRTGGQNLVTGSELVAYDAAGNNPVVLLTFTTNVSNASAGSRILITTSNFASYNSSPVASDFTMSAMPASYLAAGRLAFQNSGLIYWSVSWGGAAYTGPNTGTNDNDVDGNFAPPFAGALPSASTAALRFNGAASALSTNNAADYSVAAGAATFTNNAGDSTTLIANTLFLIPQKDNTLYLDPFGQVSNGQGFYLFAGMTQTNALRRGLIAFDLSSIPTNATVTGATLSMFLNRPAPNAAAVDISLSKVSRNWGEGASDADDPEGFGIQAEPGDATWLHTFYDTALWTNPGGDFSPTFSATTPVDQNATYTWSGSGVLADVRSWVSSPAGNFGWVILGPEMITQSAQRFNSGENTSNPPQLTVTYQLPSTLGNISTRLRVLTGDNALIGGMIATGTEGKRVIIRGIGPSLSDFGVPGALSNPTLELFQGSTLLFSNDDWGSSSQQAEIAASGFAPTNAAESAIIWTLSPGENYTAIVRGASGGTGVGIVEAYDLNNAAASKLGNISTRGFVDVGDNVMIAGLIVRPNTGPSVRILVRALGPTLGDFGVPGVLPDPTLDLVNSSGTVIRTNNNWQDDPLQASAITAAGLAPGHGEEAALVETVAPGSYTAIVRGIGDTPTGVALVEVYHLP
jgi:hypothetical protein